MTQIQGKKKSKIGQWASRLLNLNDPNRALSSILIAANVDDSLQDRILWLSRLVAWMRGPKISVPEDGAATRASMARLRYFLHVLERQVSWRQQVSQVIASISIEGDASTLFAQTELTEQSGFFSEIFRRFSNKFFPPVPRPQDLTYVLEVLFSGSGDDEFLEAIPVDDWDRFLALLEWNEEKKALILASVSRSLNEAILNLSVQIAAIALTPEVRSRLKLEVGTRSPFNELLVSISNPGSNDRQKDVILQNCSEKLHQAYAGIETSGVSLALLYRLETLTGLISRLHLILKMTGKETGVFERQHYARSFLIELVRTMKHRRSLRPLMQMNFDIFARKLVEHAGETGEHYITRTKKEFWSMFRSGGGGGVLMIPATFIKFGVSALHMPLFLEALILGFNYSITFLTMQFLGASLATKQPSMTAAALADKLSSTMSRERLDEFVDEIVRISRSQFIAAVGNVGFVVPCALLISFVFRLVFHHPILDPAYAAKTIHGFHPFKSLALFYASIAGVLLWFSSLCAGWLQNLVIYRELPEAIAHHRTLNDLLGAERCRRLGDWLLHNAAGIGGNTSIGFLLAFAPIVGVISGLPIDIRHVTIGAAQISVAFMSLDPSAITWQMVAMGALGVVLIGACNFGVSMALALFVAVRAKKVRGVWIRALIAAVGVRFRRKPWVFFLPPSKTESLQAETRHQH